METEKQDPPDMLDLIEKQNGSEKQDPPVERSTNLKFEKMARQKARSSVAMRRGTTRVQGPNIPAPPPPPPKAKSVKISLERHLESYARQAKDEHSVVSADTGSDNHSVISKSDVSEAKKVRPTRPRRAKKYPPPVDPGSPDDKARQEGLKRNLEDASVVMQDVMSTSSPFRSPLSFNDLSNVAKRSLEMSHEAVVVGTGIQPPTLRQKVKEQQAQKKLVTKQLLTSEALKKEAEANGSNTEGENSPPPSHVDHRSSRATKMSNALQRKRPVVVLPSKMVSIPSAETDAQVETQQIKPHTSASLLDVALTTSESCSSSTVPSPTSDVKHEVETTKTGARLAVMAAARRTKLQNSPSGKYPTTIDGPVPSVDSEGLSSASSRLSVFATPKRTKSRTTISTEETPPNSCTRSLDVETKRSQIKLLQMSPMSNVMSHSASRPDPPSEKLLALAASPSVLRSAALHKLSVDPALKRFHRVNRMSTGSLVTLTTSKQCDDSTSVATPCTSSESNTNSIPHHNVRVSPCPSRVPSLQPTFSSHSEETASSYPSKVAVGDVAVGDIIEIFQLYRSTKKTSKEPKALQTKHSQPPSKPSTGLSESGKAYIKSRIVDRSPSHRSSMARYTPRVADSSPAKSSHDSYGLQFPTDTTLTTSGWEAFP